MKLNRNHVVPTALALFVLTAFPLFGNAQVVPGKLVQPVDTSKSETVSPSGDKDKEWVQKTQKSITIMSNVLDEMLQKQLGEGYKSKGFFSEGCRGYWIPDTGLLFLLQVDFPLINKQVVIKKDEIKKGNKDLWDEYEEKIEGSKPIGMSSINIVTATNTTVVSSKTFTESSPLVTTTQPEVVVTIMDVNALEKKVEALRQTLLEAVAKYGKRFEGFQDNDTITFIVESPSLSDSNAYTFSDYNILKSDSKDEDQLRESKITLEKFLSDDQENRKKQDEITKREMELAQRQLEDVKKLSDAGRVPTSDVRDAEKELLELQRKLADFQSKDAIRQYEESFKRYSDMNKLQQRYNPFYYQFNPPGRQAKTTMVIQVAFRDIPKEDGTADSIKDKVRITTYDSTGISRASSLGKSFNYRFQAR